MFMFKVLLILHFLALYKISSADAQANSNQLYKTNLKQDDAPIHDVSNLDTQDSMKKEENVEDVAKPIPSSEYPKSSNPELQRVERHNDYNSENEKFDIVDASESDKDSLQDPEVLDVASPTEELAEDLSNKESKFPQELLAAKEFLNLKNAHPMSKNLDVLRSAKPMIPASYKEKLMLFYPLPSNEMCSEVVNDIRQQFSDFFLYMTLSNMLKVFSDDSKDDIVDSYVGEKIALTALNKLHNIFLEKTTQVFYKDNPYNQLLERLNLCIVDKQGKTIIQQIVSRGMSLALHTDFAQAMLTYIIHTDTQNPIPVLQSLDGMGNNIMHLAVQTNNIKIYLALSNAAREVYGNTEQALLWEVSALDHKNSRGKKAIDLASLSMRRELKNNFRLLTTFLKNSEKSN